jgi:hypothetical protein
MLKISTKKGRPQSELVLEVEGRLAGPWVEELDRCWEAERSRVDAADITVRLSNVSFIDETGKELLTRIFHAGARLEGSGCMVRAIIAAITGSGFPVDDCKGENRGIVATQSGGGKGE